MAEIKKIDEKDLVFINQKWTEEEKKSFSDYLKTRKKERAVKKGKKNATPDKSFTSDGLDRKAS
jgi:hypothetical protein